MLTVCPAQAVRTTAAMRGASAMVMGPRGGNAFQALAATVGRPGGLPGFGGGEPTAMFSECALHATNDVVNPVHIPFLLARFLLYGRMYLQCIEARCGCSFSDFDL